MKKHILSFILLLTLSGCLTSCVITQYKIRGTYVCQNSIETTTSFDKVWDNVIDFFAENSISINTISKESGLIVANDVAIDSSLVTFEDINGRIVDRSAWFVVPYMDDVVGGRAKCSFNVRVKKISETNTFIQVNCYNLVGYYNFKVLNTMTFKYEIIENIYPRECRSTGRFEKTLLGLFK